MKFKEKRRTKTVLFSFMVLCLFSCSFLTEATTRIHSVSYPDFVGIDETFEIIVNFDYQLSTNALYGNYIWLYYDIAGGSIEPDLDYTQYLTVAIDELPDSPRPSQVVIEVDLSTMVHRVNDTFIFRIKYIQGVLHYDSVLKSGEMMSEIYELTIGTTRASSPTASIFLSLLVLSGVVLLSKKNHFELNKKGSEK